MITSNAFSLLLIALSLIHLSYAIPANSFTYLKNRDTAALSSNSTSNSTAATPCATGVHMIVARASTEGPGEGLIGLFVAKAVQSAIPGSDSIGVDYPATLADYEPSEASGVANMLSLIQSYVASCPDSKIALMGYSQGAQVVGDVLCGTSESGFNSTPALPANLAKNIVAVVQMGDPSYIANQPQNVGTATHNGYFPRINTAACEPFVNITQSYCNNNDLFCAGGDSLLVHWSYYFVYGTAAVNFIEGRVNGTIA